MAQVGLDNPAELKAAKLARSVTRGVLDRDARPDTGERARIAAVLQLPPNKCDGLSYSCSGAVCGSAHAIASKHRRLRFAHHDSHKAFFGQFSSAICLAFVVGTQHSTG